MRSQKKFLLAICLFSIGVCQTALAASEDWRSQVMKTDAIYWHAFNQADPKGMNDLLTDDVEFYHDRGGTLLGKKALSEVNNGMKTSKNHIRRELIEGSMKLFPMYKGDKIYGAIVTGDHQFFITEPGKPEFLAGRAFFTHLMLLKSGKWKMARILSYEHVNAGTEKKVAEKTEAENK